MFGSSSFVIKSVLEGGEGWESGGIEARSNDKDDCARLAERQEGEEEDERGGDSELECAGGGWEETSAMLGGCV